MEITCSRCHQPVQADNCYCPTCGLPQLVYVADTAPGQAQQERWSEPARDASAVDWKSALRAALMLAAPAGLLSSALSPAGVLGLFWMSAAAAFAVLVYTRGRRSAWITIGAGARIGLVTGLLGGWLAFGVSGGALFWERYVLRQSSQIDGMYQTLFLDSMQAKAKESAAQVGPADAAQLQAEFAQIMASVQSPEGHAGVWAFCFASNSVFLMFFAVAGGAIGARLQTRSRKPEL